jgi:hypothetical protein
VGLLSCSLATIHAMAKNHATGRPRGEINAALLQAVQALQTPEQGPTLRELAERACVGVTAAKATAANMVRAGLLVIVRTRRVPHRARPVAEYGIPPDDAAATVPPAALLSQTLAAWHTLSNTGA